MDPQVSPEEILSREVEWTLKLAQKIMSREVEWTLKLAQKRS